MIHNIISEMIKLNGRDTQRINHALKVYGFAKCIIESETNDKDLIMIVSIASVLHDIGIHASEEKYGSAQGKYQQIEGPPIAYDIMSQYQIDKELTERVMYLIANHHTYNNIAGLDYRVLIEADFLVNLEEQKSNKDAIVAARDRYFRTETGIAILEKMLL